MGCPFQVQKGDRDAGGDGPSKLAPTLEFISAHYFSKKKKNKVLSFLK